MSAGHLIATNPWTNDKKDNCNGYEKYKIETVAMQELREDNNTRKQCLIQFREWIINNKDIENCITDDNFLLRFLRVKKYSLYMAQQMLLKYLNLRTCFKHIFYNMDYLDSNVYELISNGYIFASPFRDKKGRRVIITTGRKFDTTRFRSRDMARAHLITYETLINDEENQILGFVHIGDCGDVSPSVITMWNISEFITLARWGQQSLPMRHKEIHVARVPTAYRYIYDLIAALGSQKLQSRTRMYNTFEDLHNKIDPHVLPDEYGGKMPLNEMIELWKKELAAKRDRLLSFDKMNLLSDHGIICRKSKINPSESSSINGSFRKLEVD